MKDIVVVCTGSFGLEVYSIIKEINRAAEARGGEAPYRILGFIDDNPHALDGKDLPHKIIGPVADWQPIGEEVYAVGAAFADMKKKIVSILKARGCRFESLVAPWSIVSPDLKMGEGCFITAYRIGPGVTLGDFVNVNGSLLCPGTVIGDYSTTTGFTVVDNAQIGAGVFVGSHAVILPGVKVGDGAQVSVGSIVTEDVPAGTTVFGVPAAVIQ